MPEWQEDARCAPLPEDVFFSDDEGDQASAKIICSRCPVQRECLAFAFEAYETMTEGVWGGTTAKERTAYARAHGIRPGRIYDRLRSPYQGRAWAVQSPLQGDERVDGS